MKKVTSQEEEGLSVSVKFYRKQRAKLEAALVEIMVHNMSQAVTLCHNDKQVRMKFIEEHFRISLPVIESELEELGRLEKDFELSNPLPRV